MNGVAIDCNEGADWVQAAPGSSVPYVTALEGWLAGPFADWAVGMPFQAVDDEVEFLGPIGSSATIHVHDDMPDAWASKVVFVVKGGPAGQRWICQHECTVPARGGTVTVDVGELPPNVWLGYEPNVVPPGVPATTGAITITFS